MKRRLSIAALLALASCSIGEGDYFGRVGTPEPGHLRWCNSGEPEYLDPALVTSTTGTPIVEVLFDGLANHGPDAEPVPGLAESWDISADQRRFTFHLRKDAKWSNGRPIVADDFAYHIVRILHPQTASRNAESHWNLKNGQQFTANRVKQVLADSGPFRRGDIVEILGWESAEAGAGKELFEGANEWTVPKDVQLRDVPEADAPVTASLKADAVVRVVELRGAFAKITASNVEGWASQSKLTLPLPDTNVRKASAVLAT